MLQQSKRLAPCAKLAAATVASAAGMAGSAGGSVAVLTHPFQLVKKKLLGSHGQRRSSTHAYGRLDDVVCSLPLYLPSPTDTRLKSFEVQMSS